jgi:hypothetical protein
MNQTRTLAKLPKTLRDISFRPDQSREDGNVSHSLESKMGTFDYNNGMLAYVDGMGDVYCVPFRFSPRDAEDGMTFELSDRIASIYGRDGQNIPKMFREAGYQNGSFWVPHSNDGGAWGSKIFKDAKVIARVARQLEMEKVYDRLGVEPQLDVPEELADKFKPAWEGFDDFGYLVKNVGRFGSNNGVVAFVDKYAIPHVAPAEGELFEGLREAGFKSEGVFVPHSNDGGAWLHYMFPRESEQREQKYQHERLEAVRKEAGVAVQR